jgi:hypothetical protein
MKKLLIVCLSIIGFIFGNNLLINGDFEQDLSIGWSIDSLVGSPLDTIDRAVDFHPDADYEARVKKYDNAHAKLFQSVSIPTTNLDFSVFAKLFTIEYNPADIHWAVASIDISYLDSGANVLGLTRICNISPHCPWVSTDSCHLIIVTDTSNWNNYSFNIEDELANLPGVNPADVAAIEIALYDTTDGC